MLKLVDGSGIQSRAVGLKLQSRFVEHFHPNIAQNHIKCV